MKISIQRFCAVLCAIATLCLLSGCASTSPTGSYQLKQTRSDVDWAMVRYHNRVSFGFLTTGEQDQVTAAYMYMTWQGVQGYEHFYQQQQERSTIQA